MDLNGCLPRACLFFLDVMSMLALMHNGFDLAKLAAEFASLSKKVGYSSTDKQSPAGCDLLQSRPPRSVLLFANLRSGMRHSGPPGPPKLQGVGCW